MEHWTEKIQSDTFLALRTELAPARCFNTKITVKPDDADDFAYDFEEEAVLPVQTAVQILLDSETFQRQTRLRECNLSDADDEDIATEDCVWAPRYVIKFGNFGESHHDARLIRHVEFLAGRIGALSDAYEQRNTGKWASLRCVLGDIAQWMLINNHRYSFLLSSDEIMFLRMDINERKHEANQTSTTLFHEPWLQYSTPMKITEVFDAEARSITTRMGLFYLLWLVMQNDGSWRLPDEMGNCLNYAAWTQHEKDLEPKRPVVPVLPGHLLRTDSMTTIHW